MLPLFMLFISFFLSISIILILIFIVKYRKNKNKRLIIDNQILRIQHAKIENSINVNNSETVLNTKEIDIVISCFGILLDSRVIKFNHDGIFLKKVEISRDYLSLSYGTNKQTQKIQILYGKLDTQELNRITERFKYETGIVPLID